MITPEDFAKLLEWKSQKPSRNFTVEVGVEPSNKPPYKIWVYDYEMVYGDFLYSPVGEINLEASKYQYDLEQLEKLRKQYEGGNN